MTKCYQVLLTSLVCLVLAAPVVATEIASVEPVHGSLVRLEVGSIGCCNPIYDNTTGDFYYTGETPHWFMLDDGAFPAGTAPVSVNCLQIGFQQNDEEQLYILVEFWDTLIPGCPVCNVTWIGGVGLDFGVVGTGGWWVEVGLTGSIDFPDDDWCVQMSFWQSIDPWIPATSATVLFAGGGPTIGSNDGTTFWLDANASETFECTDEARGFGPENPSQFFLKLFTNPGPSPTLPTTWGTIKSLYR